MPLCGLVKHQHGVFNLEIKKIMKYYLKYEHFLYNFGKKSCVLDPFLVTTSKQTCKFQRGFSIDFQSTESHLIPVRKARVKLNTSFA